MDDILSETERTLRWLGHVIRMYHQHSQQGVKDENHLGESGGGSSKQFRMASKCGLMHPLGCGLNQGQGHKPC